MAFDTATPPTKVHPSTRRKAAVKVEAEARKVEKGKKEEMVDKETRAVGHRRLEIPVVVAVPTNLPSKYGHSRKRVR